MKTHTIDSDREKLLVINKIKEIPVDSTFEIIIKKVDKSSTAKQRGLKWQWNKDVKESGLGSYDNEKDIHIWNKIKFGHPICMRDDDFYPALYTAFTEKYKYDENYPEMLKWFTDKHILTEKFKRAQNAEYLTNVQQYWSRMGVNLTDPDDIGRNLLKYNPKKCR